MASSSPTWIPGRRPPVWLVLMAALTAIGPLSIDMYLPAFPVMGEDLNAEGGQVEQTLATFFIGLALGQLVYGPLSDRFGRKPPLYFGLGLYALASLACALAPSVEALQGWRFVQALGGCAGMVVSRAVIRDRCDPRAAARAFSLLMLIMGVAPILAPLLGSMLLGLAGWRWIFAVLAVFGIVVLVCVDRLMTESLPQESAPPLRWRSVLVQYGATLKDSQFMGYTLCMALIQAGMFAYIAGSPFVLIDLYGVPAEHYGWIFGLNAVGLIGAAQLNSRWISRVGVEGLLRRALWVPAISAAISAALVWTGQSSLWSLWLGFFAYMAGVGSLGPTAGAIALSQQGHRAGTASALMGALQFGLGTLSGLALSLWHDGSARPLVTVMAVCGLLGLLLHRLWAQRFATDD